MFVVACRRRGAEVVMDSCIVAAVSSGGLKEQMSRRKIDKPEEKGPGYKINLNL